MLKIPRVAIFKAAEAEEQVLKTLLARHEYSVRYVLTCQEIEDLVQEEQADFDCILLPPQTQQQISLASLLLQLKSNPKLIGTPTIVLINAYDRETIQALYNSGADVVLIQPCEAEHLFLQIAALARQKRSVDQHIKSHYEDSGLRHSVISAFNSLREGLVICDPQYQLTFINSAGSILFGIKPAHTIDQIKKCFAQLQPLTEKHYNTILNLSKAQQETTISKFQTLLKRLDGQSCRYELRISAMLGEERQIAGFALAFSDISGIVQLSQLLTVGQRSKSLALLLGAASAHLFQAGNLHAPLQKLEQFLQQEASQAVLADTISYLLELLDPTIPAGIEVKIKSQGDHLIAYRPSDLLQLLGYLFLTALDHVTLGGEIILEVIHSQPRTLTINITSRVETRVRIISDDFVSQIIEGSLTASSNLQKQKVSQNIASAQLIAGRYKSEILVEEISDLELKLAVDLPLVYA